MGHERASAFREMNNFLHKAIYDLLTSHRDCSDKYRGLKSLKAQISRLHAQKYRSMTLDTGVEDRYGEEEPSLFHLLRAAKRRERTVHQIHTPDAGTVNISHGILEVFRDHITSKYATIPIDQDCKLTLFQQVIKRVSPAANEAFECPITHGELYSAIQQGKRGKAPGPDGIAHEFYQTFWGVIHSDLLETLNDMYFGNCPKGSQKYGLLICLPKHGTAVTIEDFRPLTILNTD
jgi:hypothetical protein